MKIPEPPGIRGKKAEHGPQKEKIYIYICIHCALDWTQNQQIKGSSKSVSVPGSSEQNTSLTDV